MLYLVLYILHWRFAMAALPRYEISRAATLDIRTQSPSKAVIQVCKYENGKIHPCDVVRWFCKQHYIVAVREGTQRSLAVDGQTWKVYGLNGSIIVERLS